MTFAPDPMTYMLGALALPALYGTAVATVALAVAPSVIHAGQPARGLLVALAGLVAGLAIATAPLVFLYAAMAGAGLGNDGGVGLLVVCVLLVPAMLARIGAGLALAAAPEVA